MEEHKSAEARESTRCRPMDRKAPGNRRSDGGGRAVKISMMRSRVKWSVLGTFRSEFRPSRERKTESHGLGKWRGLLHSLEWSSCPRHPAGSLPRPTSGAFPRCHLQWDRYGGTSDHCLRKEQHCRTAAARSAWDHQAPPASNRSCHPCRHKTTRSCWREPRAMLRTARSYPSLSETATDSLSRVAP